MRLCLEKTKNNVAYYSERSKRQAQLTPTLSSPGVSPPPQLRQPDIQELSSPGWRQLSALLGGGRNFQVSTEPSRSCLWHIPSSTRGSLTVGRPGSQRAPARAKPAPLTGFWSAEPAPGSSSQAPLPFRSCQREALGETGIVAEK